MRMRYPFFILPLGVVLAACSHTSEPPEEDDCLDPKFRAPVEVSIDVDQSFLPYTDVDSTRYADSSTRARERGDESWRLKYYLAAYRREEMEPTEVLSSMDNKITMNLPPDKYTFVAWADRVPADNKSYYFYTDDFSELLLKHKYEYVADDPFKVPYRGENDVRVQYTTTSTSLKCKPAMGKYRLLATDSLTYKPGRVLITYLGALPASIHGRTGHINYYWNDMYFNASVVKQDSIHEIAHDFVLSHSDEETKVAIRVEIFDEEDNLKSRCRQLVIPLKNGGITTVKGNFFSMQDFENTPSTSLGGGIVIDPNFDETIEIEI